MTELMNIDDTLHNDFIILNSKSTTKKDVIQELTETLFKAGRVNDKDVFISDVYERESLGSTGFDNEIAIPHGKSSAVTRTSIAVAKLLSPVDWEGDDEDEDKIRLVFLFAVAKVDASDHHVKLLARISQTLCDDEKVELLKGCMSPSDFKKIL